MEQRKIHGWAGCHGPWKKLLNELGSDWIEGLITNESLAFQAVKLNSNVEYIRQPDDLSKVLPMDDVISQIKVLTEAMLETLQHPKVTPELRLQAIAAMQARIGRNTQRAR